MVIKNANFITSVANGVNFLKTEKKLIAVGGKSNVGKSSIINMLANQKKLARTSSSPGRTRLINYFDFGEFILCDLPGYGFAKVSKEEKNKWGELIETFLQKQKLALFIMLVDIRHQPTEDDKIMVNFLYHYAIPFVIVATKADKLPKTKIKPSLLQLATSLKIGIDNILASSSISGLGKTEILSLIEHAISVE